MTNYRFTESADAKGNPIGTLEKQVTDGGGQQSWVEDMKSHVPYDKEAEKDKEHDIAIAEINSKIPAEASEENKLTDHNQVSGDIATASATFRNTYNLVNDLNLTISATREQVAAALGTTISTADNNDFCYVEVPTADATPTEIARTDRYKFNGTAWAFEFSINGFTAAEWAAIQSGITEELVQKLVNLARVAETGNYSDLQGKPTIPDAQIQSDWNQTDNTKKDFIKNKPTITTLGGYTQEEIGKLATIMGMASLSGAGTVTKTTNPEWKFVITDNDDNILLGIKQDGTWEVFADLDDILDCLIYGYSVS